MSSLGEENNVQCQFQRIENRNLGKEHFSINEQEIVSNYEKKDISQAGLYLQSFHPQCSSPSTPTTSTPCQSVPGNNFVASIHERPETSEASTCLLSNSYVPLPQLSDETLNAHLWSTDSEAGSSSTENDDVALTKKKFTRGPAGQHVYEQPSSNLHTPQYETFHYNSESRTMSSVSPNSDRSTLYTTFEKRDSEASSSGAENSEVANTAVYNTLTENNLTGGRAGQYVYGEPSSNLHTPQYATFHYNSEPRTMFSVSTNRDRSTLYTTFENRDSEASSSGAENAEVINIAVDNTLSEKNLTGGPAGQYVYGEPSSNLHPPQYATFHYNSGSRTMSSVSPNSDRSTLYTTFENRDSEASSSGAENSEVVNIAVDNTLSEKNLTGGPGQQGNAKLKKKRVRTTYEGLQVAYLENTFRENKYPDRVRRINMAHRLKLSEKQIKIWFQNRRTKDKREKLQTGNTSSMNTVPQHRNENVESAASFNFSAPIQNQNMPIFQASCQFQYMPQPLGLNVYDFQ